MELHLSVVGQNLRVRQVSGFGREAKTALAAVSPESRWMGAESAWYYPYTAGTLQGIDETAGRLQAILRMDPSLKARIDKVKAETATEWETRKLIQRYIDNRKLELATFTTSSTPPPYWFQSIAWHWAMRVRQLYLQFKPGCGKTRVGCDVIRGKIDLGQVREPEHIMLPERESLIKPGKMLPARYGIRGGVLVACPRVVLGEWVEQLNRWQGIQAVPILGDADKKRKRAGILAWVHLCNYESLESVEDNEYGMVIADEAHYIANEESNRFQRMNILGSNAAHRMALSGTSISNGLKSLWAQFMWLDGGRTLGPSFEAYTKWYLRSQGDRGEKDTESAEDRVARAISRVAFPLTMREAFPDKPQKIYQVIRVPMTKEQSQYYGKLRKQTEAEILGGKVSMPEITTRLMKLLQVCQGFVLDSEKVVQQFSSAKLTELERMITGEGDLADRRLLIWCLFKHDIDRVVEVLNKHKIKHLILRGGMTDKERDHLKLAWATDSTFTVCVGMISMGIGINMHAPACIDPSGKPAKCFTAVFYGMSWMSTQLEQAMDRVYRSDQTESCLFRYLLSDDLDETDDDGKAVKPMDARIYDRLQEKLEQGVRVADDTIEYARSLIC